MKRAQISQLVAVTTVAALAIGVAVGWTLAAVWPPAGANPLWFWGASAAIVVGVLAAIFYLHRFTRAYLVQVRRLAEIGQIVLAVDPTQRAPVRGHPDVAALAAVLNEFAARHAELLAEEAARIRQAGAELEEERNQLAALMSELTEGVLVCNLDGQILLYNRGARALLGSGDGAGSALVGLGRSVFGVIDRAVIAHGVDQLVARQAQGEVIGSERLVTSFVTTAVNGRLLRTQLAPYTNLEGALRGYVITLQDISEGIERSARRDALLQALTERVRASVAAIRAASETIAHFPQMAPAQRERFQAVILDEAQALSTHLSVTLTAYAGDLRGQWRLEEARGQDLLWAIRQQLAGKLELEIQLEAVDADLWLKVDSYTLLQGMVHILAQIQADFGVAGVQLRLGTESGFGALDLIWPVAMTDAAAWQQWKEQAFVVDAGDAVITLREVAERHGGEMWCQLLAATQQAYFRLLLPLAAGQLQLGTPAVAPGERAPRQQSRPEYYDFDLFHQAGQSPELDDRRLRELTCTVFDTETTGLVPTLDEIVAIGALRLVNGRMLRQEVFEQLIDPGRPMPAVAQAVHGITDAMVRGQPDLRTVLPRFHRFAAETVLVGHNLAFDLRMFQVKEAATGVRFDQPVLDTLLLSAVVHPEEASHSLEAIAARLGVPMLGRHTALGDAIVTGEIFLRLIPLLEARAILTLRQARAAAEATYLARLVY